MSVTFLKLINLSLKWIGWFVFCVKRVNYKGGGNYQFVAITGAFQAVLKLVKSYLQV